MVSRWRLVRHLLRILVTLVLLGWILRGVDWAALRQDLLSADPFWLLLGCFGALVRLAQVSLRWRLILTARGIHFSLARVYRFFLVSALWDVFIPANLGGDAYRIRQAATQGGLLSSGASVVWDRALGSLSLFMLGGLALYLARDQPPIRAVFGSWVVELSLVFLLGGAVLLVLAVMLGRRNGRQTPEDGRRGLLRQLVRIPRRVLVGGFVLSVLSQLMIVLVFYCVLVAMGLDEAVPPLYFALSATVATLVLSLPVSIAGIGVSENLFAILFQPFGVSTASSVAFAWLAMLVGRGTMAGLGGLMLALGRERWIDDAEMVDRG